MNHNPKYRRPLNNDQAEVLNLLYKFRFVTSDLIAQYFGKKNGVHVYKRLMILYEQGYIGRRFDDSYRIQGKPAAYFLLPQGLRKLNERRAAADKDTLDAVWLYKETRVTDGFVQYWLAVFSIYCLLKVQYGDSLRFLTKSQLTNRYDYFSEFVPTVYLRVDKNGTEQDVFLEYVQTGKPLFVTIQRLKEYIEFADSGEWEAGTDSDFPAILLVCEDEKLKGRLMKRASSILGEADDDLRFYITTASALDKWQSLADQEDEPRALFTP